MREQKFEGKKNAGKEVICTLMKTGRGELSAKELGRVTMYLLIEGKGKTIGVEKGGTSASGEKGVHHLFHSGYRLRRGELKRGKARKPRESIKRVVFHEFAVDWSNVHRRVARPTVYGGEGFFDFIRTR